MKKKAPSVCHYCGVKAKGKDHVIPLSILKKLGQINLIEEILEGRILQVTCCKECNNLLNDSYQETLAERKMVLKERLSHKYRKFMEVPDWSLAQTEQMSHWLKDFIRQSVKIKEIIGRRLAH
jgi:hypothetical protein